MLSCSISNIPYWLQQIRKMNRSMITCFSSFVIRMWANWSDSRPEPYIPSSSAPPAQAGNNAVRARAMVLCCACFLPLCTTLHYTLDGFANTKTRQPADANTKARAINVGLCATITHLHSPTWHDLRTQPTDSGHQHQCHHHSYQRSSACCWHTHPRCARWTPHPTCAHHIFRAVADRSVIKRRLAFIHIAHQKHTEHVVIFHYTSCRFFVSTAVNT